MNFKKQLNAWLSFIVLGMAAMLLLAACGDEAEATSVPDMAAPQTTDTVVPPINTPIPPTVTLEPPTSTATPDITANFNTFVDEGERVTFRYPSDWQLDTDEQTKDTFVFILTSGEDALDLLGADDFSQPLGFAIGEIRWVAFFGSNDPSLILADWVEESGLDMSPTSEVSLWEQDGVNYASQDYEATNAAGDTLLLTVAVIVNGGRYGAFAFGTTSVGEETYAELAAAVFDTIEVPYLDPMAEMPDRTLDPMPTPAALFEGERAIIVREDGRQPVTNLPRLRGHDVLLEQQRGEL